MSAIKFTEREIEAMAGLPSLALRLYVLAIRPFMDYQTGLVGQRRRVSWQSLREAAFIEPHQGLTESGTPSKSAVRRAIAWLVRSGLIVERGEEKTLVFYCPLADTDLSAQKKPGTNPAQTRHTQPDTEPDTANHGLHAASGAKPGTHPDTNPTYPEPPKPGTPPESGNPEPRDTTHTVDSADAAGLDQPAGAGVCDEAESGSQRQRRDKRFEEWWSVYPKKTGKKPAREKWKAKRLDERADVLIADVQLRAGTDRKWLAGFVPNPTTYINQERWNDEIERDPPQLRAIPGGRSVAEQNRQAGQEFLDWVKSQEGA